MPDGTYSLELVPPKLIYQFSAPTIEFEVAAGQASPIIAAARRVDSPWFNADFVHDVNGDGRLTPRDALLVINEISRRGLGDLAHGDAPGMWVDTNNDGSLSPMDALRVINQLAAQPGMGEGEQVAAAELNPPPSVADPDATTQAALQTPPPVRSPSSLSAERVDLVLAGQGEGGALDTTFRADPVRWMVVDSEGNPSSDQSSLKWASDNRREAGRSDGGGEPLENADFGEFLANWFAPQDNAISVEGHL